MKTTTEERAHLREGCQRAADRGDRGVRMSPQEVIDLIDDIEALIALQPTTIEIAEAVLEDDDGT